MALVSVGADHAIAGIIHVPIFRDDMATDPQKAFSAKINAPNVAVDTAAR